MDIGKRADLDYGPATRDAFGEVLKELGAANPNIVVVDADISNSTRTEYFARAFPERFFEVGIAESNMIGVASGLAAAGKQPLAASFACFLMCNAFDQIRMGIAFPNADVKLVGSHSGITIGEDGPSQMAIEDIALACALPNFTVVVPCDAPSARAATRAMFEMKGPVYLRTGRPKTPVVYADDVEFRIGKAITVRKGRDVTIIACGLMVPAALDAAVKLAEDGIDARVIDMHTIKPLDVRAVVKAAKETGGIVTAEEHLLDGGLGAAVARVVAERCPVPMAFVGIRDTYAEFGDPQELIEKYRDCSNVTA
ncbi:MAG TPA: transketolase C-terminal domain-containing protein [Planctomycetota bacterium]|nr:transketolase C-terminal domain-containing protein [Planctomycetota bacterium]